MQISGADDESAVSVRLRRRFARWCKSVPPATRWLADSVLSDLVPSIERHGFGWNDSFIGRGEPAPIIPDHVPLERRRGEILDVVHIDFAARKKPSFVVAFRAWSSEELARRQLWMPHYLAQRTVIGGLRVKFGFSRLDPFASQQRAVRLVAGVVNLIPQLIDCLEHGACGPHVTPSRLLVPPKNTS